MISIQKIYDNTLGKKWIQASILIVSALAFFALPVFSVGFLKVSLGSIAIIGLMVVYFVELIKNGMLSSCLTLATIIGLPILIFRHRKQILSKVTALNATIFLVIAFSIGGFLWHTIHMASKIPAAGL